MGCVLRLKQLTKTQMKQIRLLKFYTAEGWEDSSVGKAQARGP